jgi:DNA-binding response OmpR family regulator
MRRILIIDDDARVVRALSLVLENEGFQVQTAADGQAGLNLLDTDEFDLAIVDIFMPGADGLETIRALRQHRQTLPVIVMSGLQFSSSILHRDLTVPDFLKVALQFGATVALQKPFKPDELLRAVGACLDPAGKHAPDRSFDLGSQPGRRAP